MIAQVFEVTVRRPVVPIEEQKVLVLGTSVGDAAASYETAAANTGWEVVGVVALGDVFLISATVWFEVWVYRGQASP